MRNCWVWFIVIFVFQRGGRPTDEKNGECGCDGYITFMITAYYTNTNMHRLSRSEVKIPYISSHGIKLQNIFRHHPSFVRRHSPYTLHSSVSDSDNIDTSIDRVSVSENDKSSMTDLEALSSRVATSSLLSPLIEPTSDLAKELCMNTLDLSQEQYQQIIQFVALIMEWNERINLISRKDCTPSTIFTRHVLPSLVGGRIIHEQLLQTQQQQQPNTTHPTIRMIDVGTGGGFPGIPLAIQYPHIQFVLADSITKKIASVQDMVDTLQLSNVNTYNGRVEEYFTTTRTTTTGGDIPKFDIVTGRSVTALPQFCSWIKDLVKQDGGHLVYWIGGHIDEAIQEYITSNISIQEHLSISSAGSNIWNDNFDKRVLIVPASGVRTIAASVPESQFQQQMSKSLPTTRRLRTTSSTSSSSRSRNNNNSDSSTNKLAKGEWRKRNDPDQPKQRGYENFQRYTSSSSSSSSESKTNPKSTSDTPSGPTLSNE